jgi:hypothetical protein
MTDDSHRRAGADAMELSMANSVKLMGLQFAVLAFLIGSLQFKSMSPRLYDLIETTIVLLGTTTMYDGMPANAFDWAF